MNSALRLCGSALALILAPLGACDDAGPRLPLGATCISNGQCVQGVCGGGECLAPSVDSDSDGLLNRIEAALGTDPVRPDTDGDGRPDFTEVVDVTAPADRDRDGAIDAVESAIDDSDGDCIPDERDPVETAADPAALAELACCCEGACSAVAPGVAVLAECVPAAPALLDCGRSADCPLGLSCQARPGRGRCVPADPLTLSPAVVVTCVSDAGCGAGEVCEAADLSGTCVDAEGAPPAPAPALRCQVDSEGAPGEVEAPQVGPGCAADGR